MLEVEGLSFHPVIQLPAHPLIRDFTDADAPQPEAEYDIGRYDEVRPKMYSTELFGGVRNIHMGIDIGAPVGTPVHAFHDGVLFDQAYLSAPGDYGHVVITRHELNGVEVWALHGHLSSASIECSAIGSSIVAGQVIGWIGDEHENGGWEPHVHFQLSLIEPVDCDLPGVVSAEDRTQALFDFPDPRLVLGPLY